MSLGGITRDFFDNWRCLWRPKSGGDLFFSENMKLWKKTIFRTKDWILNDIYLNNLPTVWICNSGTNKLNWIKYLRKI